MPEIYVTVRNKVAERSGSGCIVCGNSDYTVTFDFDSEWNQYPMKTARFGYRRGGMLMYDEVIFEGSTAEIPILLGIDCVEIGVYAGNLRTTTPAAFPCMRCILDGYAPHPDPAPDIYLQLLAYLEKAGSGGVPVEAVAITTAAPTVEPIYTEEVTE